MASFFSLSDKILLEIDYSDLQFGLINNPILIVTDENEGTKIIANGGIDPIFVFNNSEENVFVRSKSNFSQAVIGKNTAIYYPNIDDDIFVEQMPTPNISLKYVVYRLHILSGYNFQDSEGINFSIYVKDAFGGNIFLLKQSFLKKDIKRYSYNEVAKTIGDLFYDKFLEFKVINYNDILNNGINFTFFNNFGFGADPVIYASLDNIYEKNTNQGYIELLTENISEISFASSDQYELLTAHISESESGYFEYCAKWDSQSIDSFISKINSINGNNYYLIHELAVYTSNGMSLNLVDSLTQVQDKNYDLKKKYRPILPNNTTGGIKIVYTVRMINKNNGDSIIKSSSLVSLMVGNYLEDIRRINLPSAQQPLKVYSKIENTSSEANVAADIVKTISPIYVNSFGATIGGDESITIYPFDNIVELTIFDISSGNKTLFDISPLFKHTMVFVTESGSKISSDEISTNIQKESSILSFKISEYLAKNIILNKANKFYITAKGFNTETVLLKGDVKNA